MTDGQCRVGFVLGKAKLAPQPEPTIPRLELCGAVLAVEMAELILDELDHKPDALRFYCDSKVVLGYIHNSSERFFVYVHNRVHRIRRTTSPQQWHYVPTDQNPADLATRSVSGGHTLQTRRKWHTACPNLEVGDIVVLKQSQSPRNEWPMVLVTSTSPSGDGKVRKVEVRTTSQDKIKTFLRPISDVVLLLAKESQR